MSSREKIGLEKLFKRAEELKQSDPFTALSLYERIYTIQRGYRQGEVANILGMNCYLHGEHEKACDYFHYAIVNSYRQEADYLWNGALAQHHRLLQIKRNKSFPSIESVNDEGEVYVNTRTVSKYLHKALELEPTYFNADIKFCKMYLEDEDFKKFKRIAKEKSKKKSSSFLPLLGIGLIGGGLAMVSNRENNNLIDKSLTFT